MHTPKLDNKKYLLLTDNVTNLVKTAIDAVIISGGSITCVTSNMSTKNRIQAECGISCVFVEIRTGDEAHFFKSHMPGPMEAVNIESFPIWKGLSIDRLRFWHVDTSNALNLIELIPHEEIIVDLDLHSRISSLYDKLNKDLIVLKNYTLRTPEHYNFLKSSKLKSIISDKERDLFYLAEFGSVMIWGEETKLVLPTERDAKKEGTLVYYEKQYIWQYNDFVENTKETYDVVSLDERSIDLFSSCHPRSKINVTVPGARPTPETLIMFAYDENVIDRINPSSVIIYDYYSVNMSATMSYGDERVTSVING